MLKRLKGTCTSRQPVSLLDYGPAFISDKYDGLDALIVAVVQPVRDGVLQICRHVFVTLAQKAKYYVRICKAQMY